MNLHEEIVREQVKAQLEDIITMTKANADLWDRMLTKERIIEIVAEEAEAMLLKDEEAKDIFNNFMGGDYEASLDILTIRKP